MSQPSPLAAHSNMATSGSRRYWARLTERQSPAVEVCQVWNRGRAAMVPLAAWSTSRGT